MIINYFKIIYIVRINLKDHDSLDLLWTMYSDVYKC